MKTVFQWVAVVIAMLLPGYSEAQGKLPINRALEIGGMLPYLLEKEPVVNEPHKLVFYLNEGGTPVPAEQAFRRIEVSYRDSVAGVVRIYYPSGKLYKSTPYANLLGGLKHGVETVWNETGKLLMRTDFFAGLANDIISYYPNGQVQSHMQKTPEGLKTEDFDSLGRRGFYTFPSKQAWEPGQSDVPVPQWIGEEVVPVKKPRGQKNKLK